MKAYTLLSSFLALLHLSSSFLTFSDIGDLMRCYDEKGDNRITNDIVNGQTLPLPSSMETFVSLVERLESKYPRIQAQEMIQKLLISFRVDEVPSDLRFEDSQAGTNNIIERTLFNINNINYAWKEEDISEDEKCALHFMLSHSLNDTLRGTENEEAVDGVSKRPREYGVVSLHGKPKHAFALGRVLLGIYAGLLGSNQVDGNDLRVKVFKQNPTDERLKGVKVNRLTAVTIADLVIRYIRDKSSKKGDVFFMPNGEWDGVSCPTVYALEENNKRVITNSQVRGAIDGLIIGKKIEENQNYYRKLRLSEILRMYYGSTGLIEETVSTSKADIRSDVQWCKRTENLGLYSNLNEDVLNYLRFYAYLPKNAPTENFADDIRDVLSYVQGSTTIFNEVRDESIECSRMDSATEKCKTPSDIFPILDWQTNDNLKNLQIDLLGILSADFEIRPKGSSVGAYANLNPLQNGGLYVIANNTGIAGCPSCYAKHFKRIGSTKLGEVEVLNNLNQTLTQFIEANEAEENLEELKSGKPAKVVVLFNFGNPANEPRLRDALWEIRRNFREVTLLAVGSKKEPLQVFTQNDDDDIFTDTGNAASLAVTLKKRICSAPAEFQFKDCFRSNSGTESHNKQSGYIPVNKKQFWAMYPKYFLKSYGIKLKFKALNGAQIRVCFSRSYYRILQDSKDHKDCREPAEEIEFGTSNPCYKYNEHNCDPFYFSIEGAKAGSTNCENIHCRTPKDIQFEFSHEGLSCNSASFIHLSPLLLFVAFLILSKMK